MTNRPDLEGFDYQRIATSGATINVATRGKGVPLLLLHGYPENHRMWHKVAPALAQEYAVVCADLRGCEDYRAGFFVDLAHDRADVAVGRKIVCPTMILWGSRGVVGSLYEPLETWKDLVASPTGYAVDCGHFIPEEKPDDTIRALREFFRS